MAFDDSPASGQVQERLVQGARRVAALRAQTRADPVQAAVLEALKRFQATRLAATHRDLLDDARYAPATRFFLDDLYGSKDFSRRDEQLARVLPMLARSLPTKALATLADAVELDALSEELDARVAGRLARRAGGGDAAIDEAAYRAAYAQPEDRALRERQIALIVGVGRSLDALVRHPLLGALLRAMGGPARAAGLGALQEFLQNGYSAFRAMRGADEFLRRIEARERSLMDQLFGPAGAGAPPTL